MRSFKTKWFVRFARKHRIPDHVLKEAVDRAERGSIDADLGGGVIKQRIARSQEGKSGGFRSIVLFRAQGSAFFVYAFPKNVRDNIGSTELAGFKVLADEMLGYDDAKLAKAVLSGTLTEVVRNGQETHE